MPEYLSPGVYVEEIDAGPKPIEGVSTSTAGAVGVTARGPSDGKPELVTSFNEFVRKFGGLMPEPADTSLFNRWAFSQAEGGQWWQFPLSVKGFFDNGGQRLYVKRVFSSTAAAAAVVLGEGVISEVVTNVAANSTTIQVRHTLGIQTGAQVFLFVNGQSVGGFTVSDYSGGGVLRLNRPVGQEVLAGRDFIATIAKPRRDVEAPTGGAPDRRLMVRAYAVGDWGGNEISDDGIRAGTGLSVRIRPVIGVAARLLADPVLGGTAASMTLGQAADAGATQIQVASSVGFAKDDHVLIDGREYAVSVAAHARLTVNVAVPAGGWRAGTAIRRPATATNPRAAATTLSADADAGAAPRELQVASADGFAVNDQVIIDAPSGAVTAQVANVTPATLNINPGVVPADGLPVGTTVRRVRAASPRAPAATTLSAPAAAGADQIQVANSTGFKVDDRITVNGFETTVTDVGTGTPASLGIDPPVPTGGWTSGLSVRRPSTNALRVRNAGQLYRGALVELDNGTNKEVHTITALSGDQITLSGELANQFYEDHILRVIEAEVSARYRYKQNVEQEETYSNLRLVDDGTMNYLVTHVNERSKLIELEAGDGFAPSSLAQFPSVPPPAAGQPLLHWADLEGGRDNLGGLSVDDFVGEDLGSENRTGIQALEDIDEISICLAPGMWAPAIHNALIIHCETLKDRFAILDTQDELSIQEIREVREPIDTKYAALYYPWLEVRDPLSKRDVPLAPSGHMAGIYARVDVERGVHKAPANEVVRGITRLEQDVTKREQDMLNPKNINVLRYFPGRGNRVWGARVLTSDAAWKYINVRRLFIYVEESIDEGTQWVVFEPNDEMLWLRVRQTISNFLTTVWRSGALFGTKASEAFFVKCDRTTMTPDDIDNGRLICLIGIAPVKPAEFVIFRIQQKTIEAANT